MVKYRGHPSVMKEMSLFMLTKRVDPTEVRVISDRSKQADKAATHANLEVDKLKDTIASLKRNFANLKNDFATVKKTKM
jgi:predicted  nucleic acid-binding Zn-ribbon protein